MKKNETKNSRPAPPLTKTRDFFCYSLRTRLRSNTSSYLTQEKAHVFIRRVAEGRSLIPTNYEISTLLNLLTKVKTDIGGGATSKPLKKGASKGCLSIASSYTITFLNSFLATEP